MRVVVVSEQASDSDWRFSVCRWLFGVGCRYLATWGNDCSAWDDDMDIACLHANAFAEPIPVEAFVMTTWHDDETLAETFHFAKHDTAHPVLPLPDIWLLHVAPEPRQLELLRAYDAA